MTKRQFSPISMFLFALVIVLSIFLFRNEVSSQNVEAEPSSQTTNRAPSGIYLNYQGQLLDSGDQPINATLPITFRLYKTLSGGTNCWSEAHSGGNAIDVADGVFSVTLGKLTPIADSCVTDDIYLELVVNGETLSPREQLTPFANTLPANSVLRGDVVINSNTDTNEFKEGVIRIQADNPDNWLSIDQNEVGAYGQPLGLQTSNTAGDIHIGTNVEIRGEGQSIFTDPQDVDVSGSAALRFGEGTNWLGIDANEINSYGDSLNLQGSGATDDVYIGTSFRVAGGGQSVFNSPEDVDVSGTGALRFGGGPNWLGIDNNEINSYGSNLNLQGSGATHNVVVHTNLVVVGTCTLTSDQSDPAQVVDAGTCGQISAASIETGAFIEANLQTASEKASKTIERFTAGDLLCWSTDSEQLALCDVANDRLVMAVADRNGKPIVMGAEPIKVIGSVQTGDILVSSDTPGYAIVNNNPAPGTVIGQALEDFNGDSGIIKAMIRKW